MINPLEIGSTYTSDYLKTDFTLKDNVLEFEIKEIFEASEQLSWTAAVAYRNKPVQRWECSREKSYSCRLEGSGTYNIVVTAVKDGMEYISMRKAFQYYDPATIRLYDDFIGSIEKSKLEKDVPPLYCPTAGFQNIALICAHNETQKTLLESSADSLKNISGELQLSELWDKDTGKAAVLAQSKADKGRLFFSGKTKYDSKLVIGQDDLPDKIDYEKFLDEIGTWTAVLRYGDKIIFTNDFYGMYKIFYYNVDGLTVASNNYHLLLLILKQMNIKLTLNVEECLPNLILMAHSSLDHQRMTDKMDVDNIIALPIDKYIKIDDMGFQIKDKSIHHILYTDMEYNEQRYADILDKNTAEIKENCYIALNDPRFKKVITDVSGGKDSRTVFAAVQNIDAEHNGRFREKIRIFSREADYTNDKAVFIGLNNIFNYKYDDIARTYLLETARQKELVYRSFYLGSSYEYTTYTTLKNTEPNKCINLIGAGEYILRSYYAHGVLALADEVYASDDIEYIVDKIIEVNTERCNSISNNEMLTQKLRSILLKAMSEMPGATLKERVDHIALFYRNVYHFGSTVTLESTAMEKFQSWTPLYTKTSLLAYKMSMRKVGGIKFQLDQIAKLCPLMAVIPFESESDNKEFEDIKDTLLLNDMYKHMRITLDNDPSEWERAKKEKAERAVQLNNDEKESILAENAKYNDQFYEKMLDVLKKLLSHKDSAFGILGIDLFCHIISQQKINKGKPIPRRDKWLYNKLISVVDQIEIIGEDNNSAGR
ncbi:MAG: hypothetical protein K2N38_15025 [Oscillospiraceae bacterium]|nr:hypothetical protein [Oscillospiraceae bacterium]